MYCKTITRSLALAAVLGSGPLHAQTMRHIGSEKDKDADIPFSLYIVSDAKAKEGTQSTDEAPTTGTGALGVSFTSPRSYGSITFNVFNRNKELIANDSTSVGLFSNNLLIPENSGSGISNANITLGMRNFWSTENDKKILGLHRNRIGGFCYLQVNKTDWTKDSVTTSLFIQSHGAYISYRLLDLAIDNDEKDDLYFTLYVGYEGRRIGGDYALDKNEAMRTHFLGTTDTAFDGVTFGALLELGQFYGKLHMTTYETTGELDGFSGFQAQITMGMNVQFNVKATGR